MPMRPRRMPLLCSRWPFRGQHGVHRRGYRARSIPPLGRENRAIRLSAKWLLGSRLYYTPGRARKIDTVQRYCVLYYSAVLYRERVQLNHVSDPPSLFHLLCSIGRAESRFLSRSHDRTLRPPRRPSPPYRCVILRRRHRCDPMNMIPRYR